MKRTPIYINFRLIYIFFLIFLCPSIYNITHAQGYNNNEWIFGYCGPGTENNYISFGKGGSPNVNTLPGNVVVGQNNNAIAINPITGEPLFYTNGELVYNYLNEPIQGAPNGINGNFDGIQTVAISPLNYDPEGEQTFYTFYISPSGQLQYAVMDMNAQGAAPANSPPAGEVTSLDHNIGTASGAIAVVKTPDSPSYLISFENGQLVSREITDIEGDFIETDNTSLPITPERIIFDEATGTLILIPENPEDAIYISNFDTASGTFTTPEPIAESPGTVSNPHGGATVSPDGNYIIYSQGDNIQRVPINDLNAPAEQLPVPPSSLEPVQQIHDIKIGPDGQLYYIYQEPNNDAFYVGTIENPAEEEITEVIVDADPFDGTDFCGGIFPSFAPNSDIDVNVDFTWSPAMPCMNNPLQLTSTLTPPNIPIESYEWEISPPPVDEDGEEIEMDLTEEHLLIPADATGEQNITVTLTVTLADGSTETVSYPITFTENNLQASFTPSDTTTCLQCLDLNEMLEVQSSEEGQGGGSGGGGGGIGIPGNGGGQGGGGSGSTYEYFWSNKKEDGWIPEGANEVCEPGTYWVLAREPGSTCYVYAETTIKMWDPVANEKVNDQTNNIWYFGNGAGLDFNPDPDNPDGPLPRPVEDPGFTWDIPAGTTTISDQAGQVLFYTDGQTVWDLNGNVMQDGDDIGGDNSSAQSVIAVKVPQEQTLYYLFTTESSGGGSNTVKFSLVDIKGENQQGVGSVVSSDNFLFSPGTEQSAAIASGDTTWVMFHELGNNTFRAYPVTSEGVGQSVNSSVGTDHGFSSGVGSMKFSPDGEKLAVTIVDESGCSVVDVFDFDESTGELREYATIDLGCDDEVYGLEFGSDSNKVFVSYKNGKGIEEFPISGTEIDEDDGSTSTCPDCFQSASTQDEIEQCILANRSVLSGSTGGTLGALQMGPDGQIYVSVVGAPQVGQIQPGADCNNSTYNPQGPITNGTNNLGLPSYVQNSGSNVPDPEISGPERLCLIEGEALAEFEGAGEPDIDFYNWVITDSDGLEVFTYAGEGDDFQLMEYAFDSAGVYTVSLDVERCGNPEYYRGSMEIEIVAPPELTLQDDITLCSGNTVTLTAIDGYDPSEGLYNFEWINSAGEILGDSTSNSIDVTEESIYTVTVNHVIPAGADSTFQSCPATASVFVGPAFDFEVNQDAESSCYEENYITFAPDTPVSGEWSYQLQGSNDTPTILGEGYEWEVNVEELPGPGTYDIIFRADDPILPGCVVEKRVELLVSPLPELTTNVISTATDCATPDGSFEFTMLSDADTVTVVETGEVFLGVTEGQTIGPIADLLPGIYTITAVNGGCSFTETVSIDNENPPAGFSYTISVSPESCGPTGVDNGSISIILQGTPNTGSYVITREDDGEQFTGTINGEVNVSLEDGTYAVEVSDPAGCAVPDAQNYIIENQGLVSFSVPSNAIACEVFYFAPEPANGVNYTITGPDGSILTPQPNDLYVMDQEGVYTIVGEDPNGVECPRTREMNLTLTNQVEYELADPIFDCENGVRYLAELGANFNEEDYNFLWRNTVGEIIGRGISFVPNNPGDYSLDVQPKVGAGCPRPPIEFTVEPFTSRVPVELILDAGICSNNPTGTIQAVFTAPASSNIETAWFTVDEDGVSSRLPEFDGMTSIPVTQEGTYRVRLINESYGQLCAVGTDRIDVLSSNAEAPLLQPSYTICAIEGVTETLDSLGNWSEYEWWLEDDMVSTDSTFTPTLPGNYTLFVTDEASCTFAVNFEVIQDCALLITTPNALIPGDESRNFIVYVNDFVDEISVLIYNRWGELIYHCIEENVPENSPFCQWDGLVNGKKVPVGTYPVIIKFKSRDQAIEKTIKKAIVVIE
ncbi:gliding motility-associated C-terminal domain-containing protein [Echinicola sp. CAU 1574]|uniref:Gliding motility-associated C-terminal domain-containing protein n=1 Tax=Echinicola arenosa TaxID=2774144 RepID=A0ABR9AQH6_9BACT|nr:gliding motility-associated C-terminal domain-containing protein [Echinicola arenosa]MBD8490190.1 gliding motility-associated C-terminal domain-containing protein [Echinicola arenosa]